MKHPIYIIQSCPPPLFRLLSQASCITLVRVTEPSRMTLNGTEALPSEPAALQVRASYGA